MSKDIIYYTCNTHSLDIELACQRQLLKSELPIIAVSLNKHIGFGNTIIVLEGTRGPLMMHKQVLAGLEASKADWVFLCESDVLYHPSHFVFSPVSPNEFYCNVNVWRTRYPDGHCVWTDDLQQVSGYCASRQLLLDFYKERIDTIERDGFNRHYEPGPKTGRSTAINWMSAYPNLDIRHSNTLTGSKWSPDEFRNKMYAQGWKEASEVPGWGVVEGRLEQLLTRI